jgi:dihydroorotase
MPLKDQYDLPAAADFHVHLRDGTMAAAVVPTIRQGGVDTVYVMPNLVPPVTTVKQALDYRERLLALDGSVKYLMTLYLHESITPEVVREAKKAGIAGIKVITHPLSQPTHDADQ